LAHSRLVSLQTESYGARMQTMRETWTDERLDDLNGKVDRGFERIDADLRSQRAETKAEFTAMRGEMKAGFDTLYQLMLRLGGGALVALIGLIATQL
jgi:hypothetical protein